LDLLSRSARPLWELAEMSGGECVRRGGPARLRAGVGCGAGMTEGLSRMARVSLTTSADRAIPGHTPVG
jgi:hypothetical protein